MGQTNTAALMVAGYTTANSVESWNGSSWTEIAEINSPQTNAMGRSGTSTEGLIFGGYNPNGYLALTESWNGTSWTEVADLSTARYGLGGQGATSKSGLAFAGNTPASDPAGVTSTEEWTIPEALKTLTSTNA